MAQAPSLNFHEKPASQFALKSYSNGVVETVFFCQLEGLDDVFGLKVVHDADNNFASIALLKAIGVEKFAVFEQVVEGYSRCHVVSDNF